MRRVFREQILVDDQWQTYDLGGPIIHVATRAESYVEFWYIDDDSQPLETRELRVFGTGHPLPDDAAVHIGSTITPNDGRFVWHLFERVAS